MDGVRGVRPDAPTPPREAMTAISSENSLSWPRRTPISCESGSTRARAAAASGRPPASAPASTRRDMPREGDLGQHRDRNPAPSAKKNMTRKKSRNGLRIPR